MDEFGSPLSGGIRAVRRNISSSFLGAQRSQTDTISNDLIQEQSLKLTTVSGQLQNISRQLSTLDFNLKAVRENLALSDQLERQRAAANQKRERQLAEQGLREGKESALEQKIQSSLTQPLRVIGARTQGVLSRLTNFLFTLAGGWLTITGIDLLQSMAEGNVDKINRLKTKFLTGLTVILGSLTAIQLGIKKTIGILGFFAGNVARVAFGGVLRASFAALRLLFGGLVKRAGKLGGLGGVGQTIRTIIDFAIGEAIINLFRGKGKIFKRIPGFFKGLFQTGAKKTNIPNKVTNPNNLNIFQRGSRKIKKVISNIDNTVRGKPTRVTTSTGSSQFSFNPIKNTGGFDPRMQRSMDLFPDTKTVTFRQGGLLNRAKGLFNRGKTFIDDGVKAVSNSGVVKNAQKLMKGLPKTGAGKFLGKALGPLYTAITFFSELMGEGGGLVSALSSVGGYLAGAKIGALAFGSIGALFGGVGAAPLAFIGGIIGGIAGETAMKSLSKKIMSALGMKDIKVFNRDKKDDVEGVTADSNNIEAVKNGNLDAANKISDFSEDKPQVIDLSQNNTDNSGAAGGGAVTEEESNTIPDISFNNNNTHVLAATVNYGF